jgi:mannitol-1-phosphate/altronate dehydrogenase
MGEKFIQWVIEDNFIAGRPAWEKVGAEMVESVHAYEEAKIRILNATHSCIARAGTLAGYTYIHEGTHDAAIRRFADELRTDLRRADAVGEVTELTVTTVRTVLASALAAVRGTLRG